MKDYETVIGLEVHVELATATKIFCGCSTSFGGAPNTHCCPVCMGMPGTLPTLNKKVVEYAIAAGVAMDCEITRYSKFDRKNYFYPDLPKAYQVSQLYLPICRNGFVEIETGTGKKKIGIHELHMEEDAGKLVHDPWEDCTLVDYNRCGVPLIEIVSEPDMRSADEVLAYLEKLKLILQYLGVSDCKMQEGSLRADINLSVREIGAAQYGTRTEMKNMNSFKAIARAIDGERKRQIELLHYGKKVVQETRRWDDNKDTSFAMRSKEDAQDYRYFPEPDLAPMEISEEWISAIKARQPELRDEKLVRYQKEYGIPAYDAAIITGARELTEIFEKTVELCGKPKEVSNWLMVEAMRILKEHEAEPDAFTSSKSGLSLKPQKLAELIKLVAEGKVNRTVAKEVFELVVLKDIEPLTYIREHGLEMVNDGGMLSDTIDRVIAENPQSVRDYLSGKDRAFGYIVGQVMKAMKGKGDPVAVNKRLKEKLDTGMDVSP